MTNIVDIFGIALSVALGALLGLIVSSWLWRLHRMSNLEGVVSTCDAQDHASELEYQSCTICNPPPRFPLCPYSWCHQKDNHYHYETSAFKKIWFRAFSVLLLLFLVSCASSGRKPICFHNGCELCCNDDGKVCPPCQR